MANLTRYDPLSAPTLFETPVDDLLRDFVRSISMPAPVEQQLRSFRMDVDEADNSYIVHADLPGVKKENIKVSIQGNQVAIDAEVKGEAAPSGKEQGGQQRSLRKERYEGHLYRSFVLPEEVDENGAKAKYDGGVLTLTLPKKMQQHKPLTVE